MSDGEWMVLLLCMGGGLFLWGRLLFPVFTVSRLFQARSLRAQIFLVPPTGLAVLFFFLRRYADALVRTSPEYLFFYVMFGMAWMGVATSLFPLLGLNLRDDVLERSNPAARSAWIAAVLAVTFCFAGANIGDGPGWWVVLFCAGLSTGSLFLLTMLLTGLTQISERVSVERDRTAGRRWAGFLLGAGLLLGRASAGDWTSVDATFVEFFRDGWPVLVLLALAVVAERILGALTAENPEGLPGTGWPVAIAYAGSAALLVRGLGPW